MENNMSIELLNVIKLKASKLKKTIVLPESHDERVLKAASLLSEEKTVNVIILGNEANVMTNVKKLGLEFNGVRIIDHLKSEKLSDFTNIFFNIRKHKKITIEQARKAMERDLFFSAMMVFLSSRSLLAIFFCLKLR